MVKYLHAVFTLHLVGKLLYQVLIYHSYTVWVKIQYKVKYFHGAVFWGTWLALRFLDI